MILSKHQKELVAIGRKQGRVTWSDIRAIYSTMDSSRNAMERLCKLNLFKPKGSYFEYIGSQKQLFWMK